MKEEVFNKLGWISRWVSLDVDMSIITFEKGKYELSWDKTCNKVKISDVFRPTDDEIEIMGYKTSYKTIFLGFVNNEEELVYLQRLLRI